MRSFATSCLFWLMAVGGGGAVAACLLLPALLEYQDKNRLHATRAAELAALERQNNDIQRQIEHAKHDPAYLERIARKEFGIQTPGVETVRIYAEPADAPPAAGVLVPASDDLHALLDRVESQTRTNPAVSIFVLPQTRPLVLGLGGLSLLSAVVLLNRWGPPPRERIRGPESSTA